MNERYRHIVSLGIAAAAISSCGDLDNKTPIQEIDSDASRFSENVPINLELSPLTVPMPNDTECTNPVVNVTVPENLWGKDVGYLTWRGRREGEEKFKPDVILAQFPKDPNQLSRTLSVPVNGSKMEKYDVLVFARNFDGEIVGNELESMEIGCLPIQNKTEPSE